MFCVNLHIFQSYFPTGLFLAECFESLAFYAEIFEKKIVISHLPALIHRVRAISLNPENKLKWNNFLIHFFLFQISHSIIHPKLQEC